MLAKTFSSAVYGIDAHTITVEVNVGPGEPKYHIVGLPDNAVRESSFRVISALHQNDLYMPRRRVVINLAPADIRKEGSAYDLACALGILAASKQVDEDLVQSFIVMGELSLDGTLKPIKGALPVALKARDEKFKGLFLPKQNVREAAIVNDLEVYGVAHLIEVVDFFNGRGDLKPTYIDSKKIFDIPLVANGIDFSDVKGQENVKRALEIAAAGGHNAILVGPPGSGKTMLAKRLPTILPSLTLNESLETTKIHSVAGKLQEDASLVVTRPFRAPHHTVSDVALVGGGTIPQPGEISLAHNGVLFLDEIPEFKRNVLEVLRQPMEERSVSVSRAKFTVEYPASFMLISSMNPCPCGNHNHPDKECVCSPGIVQKYLSRISGPLLDRIDLHIEVAPVSFSDLGSKSEGETSATIRKRVAAAREIQSRRFQDSDEVYCNAQMPTRVTRSVCELDPAGTKILEHAMEKLGLSARAYDRILKVSRTIADLDGSEKIGNEHLAEAIQYRSLDRDGWAG